MNVKPFLTAISLFISSVIYSQDIVDITDQTLKIGAGKSEEIYVGFAAGDKIIFNFKEVNDKELKEIEVVEYPEKSIFSDFKTDKVEDKKFSVSKQSVYLFRFKNSALSGRICKIHIQRIPASQATQNFNTSVVWINKQDTTWNTFTKDVVIGYDTVYAQRTKKELVKTEQREELLFDKPQRVHSITNDNGNRTSLFFTLPENQRTINSETKVIAWAYWIGVGKEGEEAWKANMQSVKNISTKVASLFMSPLGAHALGLAVNLILPNMGEDVSYFITDQLNKNLFLASQSYRFLDNGKGVAGYRKFVNPSMCQGTYFICLENDNTLKGIDAAVKVIAILETKEYEDKAYTEMVVTPRYEKKLFKEPVLKSYKTAITGL